MKKMQNALEFSHQLLSNHVNAGDTVIDGTVGNGHDTLFLAQLVGSRGTVYGFDIQERAIQQTQERLTAAPINHTHVHLFNRGHQEIASVLPPMAQVSGAIFNLGYPSRWQQTTDHPCRDDHSGPSRLYQPPDSWRHHRDCRLLWASRRSNRKKSG